MTIFYFFLNLSMLARWLDRVGPNASTDVPQVMARAKEATIVLEEKTNTFLFKEYRFMPVKDHTHKTTKG